MTTEVKKSVVQPHPKSAELATVPAKHDSANEPVEQKLSLDPTVMAAIQASVEVAMKAAVGTILEQLKPATLPLTPAPAIPVRNAGAPNPAPAPQQNYVPRLQGIPVEPHQDLRDVHPGVIQQWFQNIENRWKENFNKRKVAGSPVELSWTRG
jgi:hypothetical protein